ncbi:unnamed protein product, partial [Porites lobata]
KKRRHSRHDLSSADSESEDNDHEASGKRRREEDELSISPSDEDINEFLEESNPKEAEVTAKTTEPKEEVELLKSLEADFTDDELVGAKINQRLANIASKRWGITLPNDKLKALLAKHAKPENCPEITTVRVNPEIWDQMNNFRRKADLRVSNIQQALQKATFGILKIKLALKAEFHSLCSQANESTSRSDLLFGADLAKQVRDAKDTNKTGKDIGVGKAGTTRFSRPYNSH